MSIPISATEWLRLLILYAHLLLSMLAIVHVLSADLGLVTGKLSRMSLQSTVRNIVWLLLGLWVSGLAIVWLDTGFAPAVLAESPKLLVKFLSVSVLTVNGGLLHRLAFPALISDKPLNVRTSMLLAVTGSLSSMHWLLAAFIGIAKPLGRLQIELLLGSYALLFGSVVIASVASVSVVRRRIVHWRNISNPATISDLAMARSRDGMNRVDYKRQRFHSTSSIA